MIETRNVSLSYIGGRSLELPDVAIEAGQHALLLGPSGGGKTTLLSVIAGLRTPAAGSVSIGGQDWLAMRGAARDAARGRLIGFVFQAVHLVPYLNVRDNITIGARLCGGKLAPERLQSLCARLDITGLLSRAPSTLSQGEAQRVAIARAVYHEPKTYSPMSRHPLWMMKTLQGSSI